PTFRPHHLGPARPARRPVPCAGGIAWRGTRHCALHTVLREASIRAPFVPKGPLADPWKKKITVADRLPVVFALPRVSFRQDPPTPDTMKKTLLLTSAPMAALLLMASCGGGNTESPMASAHADMMKADSAATAQVAAQEATARAVFEMFNTGNTDG